MNDGQAMEYERICYRLHFSLLLFMLIGEIMNCIKFVGFECIYESGYTANRCIHCLKMLMPAKESYKAGLKTAKLFQEKESMKKEPFCLDICKHYEKPSESERPVQCRYRPVKSAVSRPNQKKYLKLYNGDIYHVESNTILDRQNLLDLLDL